MILYTSLHILLIVIPYSVAQFKHELPHEQHPKSNYNFFESCLKKNGVSAENFIEKSNSEIYENLNYQWLLNAPNIRPAAYVLVENEEDVQAAVNCARKFKIRILPKGGGHSLAKFSFGNSSSVVIDIRNLKTLTYNKDHMTIIVGAGWLVGPLQWKLWELGQVFTPTAICPTIGISGLATGGGHNNLARKFGLTLDSILGIHIVTASGNLLKVNEKNYSDLFWALRGGVGSSFGIVTQFVFKVYPVPQQFFYGSLTYDRSEFSKLFDAWQRVAVHVDKDVMPDFELYDGGITVSFLDLAGTKTRFEVMESKFPPTVKKTMEILSYEEFLSRNAREFSGELLIPSKILNSAKDLANLDRQSPAQIYQLRKSFYVDKEIGTEGIQAFEEVVNEMPSTMAIFFEGYGGAISEIGKNETAFVHRNGTLYNVVSNYRNTARNTTMENEVNTFLHKFFNVGKSIFNHVESYQNYVDQDLADYLQRYYGSNLGRLIQIKVKYDPENLFFNQQSIPISI